jgi:hypothetical protein
MLGASLLERRLQFAGVLLILGLLVEGLCLIWARPLAFVALVFVGVTLVGVGSLLYLHSVVSVRQSDEGG